MAEEATQEMQRHREMIERAVESWGIPVQSWEQDTEYTKPRLKANLGQARAIEDNEDSGLFSDDEGLLEAVVVGGTEYGNERVCFTLMPEGFDMGVEVELDQIETI